MLNNKFGDCNTSFSADKKGRNLVFSSFTFHGVGLARPRLAVGEDGPAVAFEDFSDDGCNDIIVHLSLLRIRAKHLNKHKKKSRKIKS